MVDMEVVQREVVPVRMDTQERVAKVCDMLELTSQMN